MKNKKRALKNEKGTTLVEIMLSVALLAIIAAPLLGAVTSSVKNNSTAKDKTEAMALAERVMGEIKAWKSISPTVPPDTSDPNYPLLPYTNISTDELKQYGNLVPYFEITLDENDKGKVTKSGTTPTTPSGDRKYTYSNDIDAAKTADFELVIEQATYISDRRVNIVLNKIGCDDSRTMIKSFPSLLVDNTILKFQVTGNISGGYKYFFDEKSQTETTSNSGLFNPRDTTNNIIRMKVTYENTAPSPVERLKVFTYTEDAVLNIYQENSTEANSGVSFLNKGSRNFEVIYMDTTNRFEYGNSINGLYKINVTIKKYSKLIYTTSSYVKK